MTKPDPDPRLVLLTGADGFLGANLARALLSRGYRVRALLQPGREVGTLDGLDVEQARLDLMDAAALPGALEGVAALVHTVASTSVWPSRDGRQWALNVDVALALALAAREAGVRRFVHVGTANSFAAGTREAPGDERGPYDAGRFGLDYQDSKRAAQERLLELNGDGFEVVVANPTFMFGPFDSKPGSGELLLQVARGKVPGSAPGGRCFADVRDVAGGIVAALERGRPGECYILGGENLSYTEAFALIARTCGTRPPRLRLPAAAVLAFGAFGSALAALTGRAPKVSLPMARISCEGQYYGSAKAVAELGYSMRPVAEGIAAARDWFRTRGML
ncbi:MAG: NAD-dependent epimerase/dehydratase family protein [Spirochaetales bacterium]|nr:NAD-dependent epimerase/dehydratase family protein [Spirochaetales bacterium]